MLSAFPEGSVVVKPARTECCACTFQVVPVEAVSLGELVGGNVKRLRVAQRQTQEDVALHLQANGLSWRAAAVAALELGLREVTLAEAIYLSNWAGGLDKLLAGPHETPVALSTSAAVTQEKVLEALTSANRLRYGISAINSWQASAVTYDQVDARAAKALGSTVEAVRSASFVTFGRSLRDEREGRLGDVSGLATRSVQARRGRVMRHLLDDLRAVLGEGR